MLSHYFQIFHRLCFGLGIWVERERKRGEGREKARERERERGREGFLSPMFSYLGGVIDFIEFVDLAIEGDTLIGELGIWRN